MCGGVSLILSGMAVLDALFSRLAPQSPLDESGMRLQILAVLGAGLLCHELHILLKRQAAVVQTFDGHLFDACAPMPDVKLLVGPIDPRASPVGLPTPS